jgi:hypothetical protein
MMDPIHDLLLGASVFVLFYGPFLFALWFVIICIKHYRNGDKIIGKWAIFIILQIILYFYMRVLLMDIFTAFDNMFKGGIFKF